VASDPVRKKRKKETKRRRKKGTGSVQFKNGGWYFVAEFPPNPKKQWIWCADEAEAEEMGRQYHRDRGTAAARLAMHPFTPYAEQWLERQRSVSRSTQVSYGTILRRHLMVYFADEPLATITHAHVQRYTDLKLEGFAYKKGDQPVYQPNTVRNHLVVLAAILKAAERDGLRHGPNPALDVKLPDPAFVPRYLTQDECDRLVAATPPEHQMLVQTLVQLGLRLGEAQALTWADVLTRRPGDHRLRINKAMTSTGLKAPKSKYGVRTLGISDEFHRRLRAHQASLSDEQRASGLVFPSTTGNGPLDRDNFRRRVFAPSVRLAGIEGRVRIHDLRHTCVALMIADNVHPKNIQRVVGHASAGFTLNAYAQLFEDDSVIRADRLGDD